MSENDFKNSRSFFLRGNILLFVLVFQEITGLAIQGLTEGDQGLESDSLGLTCLEDG